MQRKTNKIELVPSNIITGFLGVGKTTAILHLLKHKPVNERWAVLVNEFGEIGIDGSLIKGQYSEQNGIYIREVPGGCMCCTAGLPMQMALALLLNRAKPDRLLIEPTGLGHPIEVLQTLFSEQYENTLAIQKIITLVDARKLTDKRYTEHDTFNQQIAIADVIVGNKQELYEHKDKSRLVSYTSTNNLNHAAVYFTQQGRLCAEWLEGRTKNNIQATHQHKNESQAKKSNLSDLPIPQCGYIKAVNRGEGFESIGWRFEPSIVFKHSELFSFMSSLSVERMKGVFITDKGVFGYNLTSHTLKEINLSDCLESRMEIIASQIDELWEENLLACIAANVTQLPSTTAPLSTKS